MHTNVLQTLTQLHSIKGFLLFLWQEIGNLHESLKFLSKMLGQTSKTRSIYIQVDPTACVVDRPKLWMGSWGSYGGQRGWWVLLDLQKKLWLTLIHNKLLEWRSVPYYYLHTTHKCAWETFTLPLDPDWMGPSYKSAIICIVMHSKIRSQLDCVSLGVNLLQGSRN